jgi:hypothetical protein
MYIFTISLLSRKNKWNNDLLTARGTFLRFSVKMTTVDFSLALVQNHRNHGLAFKASACAKQTSKTQLELMNFTFQLKNGQQGDRIWRIFVYLVIT